MADPKWERIAAWAGAAAAVLLAGQAFVIAIPPKIDDSFPAITRYYVEHRAGIQWQLFLTGIAGVLFLWFVGSLRSYLQQSEGGTGRLSAVAFGSAIAAVGPIAVGALATSVLALEMEHAEVLHAMSPMVPQMPGAFAAGPVIRVLADMHLVSYTLSWFALGPFVAAVAIVSMRTEAFPRWHASFGYVLFFLAIASGAGVFAESGPFAPGGGVSYLTFVAFLVWMFVTSMLMASRLERQPTG